MFIMILLLKNTYIQTIIPNVGILNINIDGSKEILRKWELFNLIYVFFLYLY